MENNDIFEEDEYYCDPEQSEPEAFDWGVRHFLINGKIMPKAQQTVARVWVMPGQEEPLHQHPNCEQILHVLHGETEFRVGDSLYHLTTGDTLRIPQSTPHQAINAGWEPLHLLATFSSPRVETQMLKEEDS
jgi:mannose-6-phosphate isomerase-like protein (cupin superfamily)